MIPSLPIDFQPTIVWISFLSIGFNPLFWNIVARNEYKNQTITKYLKSAQLGCYLLAITIFVLGLIRDFIYKLALETQPISPILNNQFIFILGCISIVFGNVLVLSSTYQLGITGTFLGDYFGILMDEPVTTFPFNISNNPMYHGSTLIFLGTGLCYARALGLILTFWVYLVYEIAVRFENPFTTMIYKQRDEKNNKKD